MGGSHIIESRVACLCTNRWCVLISEGDSLKILAWVVELQTAASSTDADNELSRWLLLLFRLLAISWNSWSRKTVAAVSLETTGMLIDKEHRLVVSWVLNDSAERGMAVNVS